VIRRLLRFALASQRAAGGERFDTTGGHKRDPYLVEIFGCYVEWVPVCPEVELGLARPAKRFGWSALAMIFDFACPRPG